MPSACGQVERRHFPPSKLQVQVTQQLSYHLSQSIQDRAASPGGSVVVCYGGSSYKFILIQRTASIVFAISPSSLPAFSSPRATLYPRYYNKPNGENDHRARSCDCEALPL